MAVRAVELAAREPPAEPAAVEVPPRASARYRDLGAAFYTSRIDKQRRTRHLIRQLEALGHTVTLEAPPIAA